MGALVAALNKKGENIIPTVINMLDDLKHRGKDATGIATPNSLTTAKTIDELKIDNTESNICIGHNLSQVLLRDQPQPVQGDGFTLIFEGRLFPSPNLPGLSEAKQIMGMFESKSLKEPYEILEKIRGSYVFAMIKSENIMIGRDLFGGIPLYYSENDKICSVASERKALWSIGMKNVKSFPPGQLTIINENGFLFKEIKNLNRPPKTTINIETAVDTLYLLLLESTRKRVSDLQDVAIAFSGGIDSTIIAVLAKDVGLNVQLFSVGLEGQPELLNIKKAAEVLDLPLVIRAYNVSELEATLKKILWLIEESNPINTSIAVPFYWLAETVSKSEYSILLTGQGADEIFGGYHRYSKEYLNQGEKSVEATMYNDIQNSYKINFQRDNQVYSFHGIEIRNPFVDLDVVDFSLRLPIKFKLNSIETTLRKKVLRNLADKMDIPDFIINKPKKAVQYSTGVSKALKQLAKNNGLSLKEYVIKMFESIYGACETGQ